MTTHFKGLHSYKLASALADDIYRDFKRWADAHPEAMLPFELLELSAGIGAVIARATGFEEDSDVRLQVSIVKSDLSALEQVLTDADSLGLLSRPMAPRVARIREALSQDFPRA